MAITDINVNTRFEYISIRSEGAYPCLVSGKFYNSSNANALEYFTIYAKPGGNFRGGVTQDEMDALETIKTIYSSANGLRNLAGQPARTQVARETNMPDRILSNLEVYGHINFILSGSKERHTAMLKNRGAHLRFGSHENDNDSHPQQVVRHGFVAEPYAFPSGSAVHLDVIPDWRLVPGSGQAFEFVCDFDLDEDVTTAQYTTTYKGRALGVFLNGLQQNAPDQADVDLTALHDVTSYPGNYRVNEIGTNNFYLFTLTGVDLVHHATPNNTKLRRVAIKGAFASSVSSASVAAKSLQIHMNKDSGNTDDTGVSAPRKFGGKDVPVQAKSIDFGEMYISGKNGVPRLTGIDHLDNRPWSTPFIGGRVIQWLTLPVGTNGHRRMPYTHERGHVQAIHFEGFNQDTNYLSLVNPVHYCDGWGVELPLEVHNGSLGKTYERDLTILDWNGNTVFKLRPGEKITFRFICLPNGDGELRAVDVPKRIVENNVGGQALFSTNGYWTVGNGLYKNVVPPLAAGTGDRIDTDAFTYGSAAIATNGQALSAATVVAVAGSVICNLPGRVHFLQTVQLGPTDSATGSWPTPAYSAYRANATELERFDWGAVPTVGADDSPVIHWQGEATVAVGDILFPTLSQISGTSLTFNEVQMASCRRVITLEPEIYITA